MTKEKLAEDALKYASDDPDGHPAPEAYTEYQRGKLHGYIDGYEAAEPKWIRVEEDAPYDGDYLCYLEQKQECGNIWYKQMVLQNAMNKFIIPSGWTLTHWTLQLPPPKTDNNENA